MTLGINHHYCDHQPHLALTIISLQQNEDDQFSVSVVVSLMSLAFGIWSWESVKVTFNVVVTWLVGVGLTIGCANTQPPEAELAAVYHSWTAAVTAAGSCPPDPALELPSSTPHHYPPLFFPVNVENLRLLYKCCCFCCCYFTLSISQIFVTGWMLQGLLVKPRSFFTLCLTNLKQNM